MIGTVSTANANRKDGYRKCMYGLILDETNLLIISDPASQKKNKLPDRLNYHHYSDDASSFYAS